MKLRCDAVGRLLVANTEPVALHTRIAKALSGDMKQSDLPGLMLDLGEANLVLLHAICAEAPDVAAAMARGLRSTEDLHVTERVCA